LRWSRSSCARPPTSTAPSPRSSGSKPDALLVLAPAVSSSTWDPAGVDGRPSNACPRCRRSSTSPRTAS
jgi:hypothetical protein